LAAEDSLLIEDAQAQAHVCTQTHTHMPARTHVRAHTHINTHTQSHCSFTFTNTKFILCITFLSGLTILFANNFFLLNFH